MYVHVCVCVCMCVCVCQHVNNVLLTSLRFSDKDDLADVVLVVENVVAMSAVVLVDKLTLHLKQKVLSWGGNRQHRTVYNSI